GKGRGHRQRGDPEHQDQAAEGADDHTTPSPNKGREPTRPRSGRSMAGNRSGRLDLAVGDVRSRLTRSRAPGPIPPTRARWVRQLKSQTGRTSMDPWVAPGIREAISAASSGLLASTLSYAPSCSLAVSAGPFLSCVVPPRPSTGWTWSS